MAKSFFSQFEKKDKRKLMNAKEKTITRSLWQPIYMTVPKTFIHVQPTESQSHATYEHPSILLNTMK